VNERDDHLRYEEDLAAYLLDALSGEEAGDFERHLQDCPRCRERARWLSGSVELLPTAIEQVEPPPQLRERLMRTVHAEAKRERSQAGREERGPAGYRRGRLARLLSVPRPALALGAAAVIAVAAVGGYALGSGGDETTTVTARAAPGVTATVERDGDRGILRVSGLEQRTDGIYEVWLERDGKVEPSTLFQVQRDGTGAAAIPRGLEGADRVMVTLEARGGSAQPTRAPLIVAKV
jgi:anti-sigma factor RsiW